MNNERLDTAVKAKAQGASGAHRNGGGGVSVLDHLGAYVEAGAGGDPFKVQAGIRAMADEIRMEAQSDPRVMKSLRTMDRSASACGGLCSLHLDHAFSVARRGVPWWKRKKFDATEEQWKVELWRKLTHEAEADISRIRGGSKWMG